MKAIITATSFGDIDQRRKLTKLGFFDLDGYLNAAGELDIKKADKFRCIEKNFNSLEDLRLFVDEYGECIISQYEGVLYIEIYNDFRED